MKVANFWDRKCLGLRGTRTPIFGFIPNALNIWAIRTRHLLSQVFEYWLWRYRYFWSKVNIWNVNCARATASIFDTRMDVLVEVIPVMIHFWWYPGKPKLIELATLISRSVQWTVSKSKSKSKSTSKSKSKSKSKSAIFWPPSSNIIVKNAEKHTLLLTD